MLVNKLALSAIFVNLKTTFNNAFAAAPTQWDQIAMLVPSTGKSNDYAWLSNFPRMKKWIDEKTIKALSAFKYSIVNDDWEATVEVDRNDIEDDLLGIYKPQAEMAGFSAKQLPDEIVFDLLNNGFTAPCYDGQYFFDTDHPVYPKADGTGVAVPTANVVIDEAYTGEPWYVLDTKKALKPFIFQERKKPELVSMTKTDDEAVFTSKQFRYGVDCRDAAGYGFWQMAFANKRTLNADNLWDCIQKIRQFEADGGRKLGIAPTMLVVPPSLEKLATRLLERELDANSSNELKGRLELVVADYL